MRRLQRPLDPNAVKAANAALKAETGGRQLTMEPEDTALREKWVDSYLAAGGKEVKNFNSNSVKKPVEACPTSKWIELHYWHCDGTPVKKAKYNIKSPEYSKSGTLDDNGFVHIDGVPDTVDDFQYWFEADPEEYKPKPPEISTESGKPKEAATSALDDIGHWIWGTVQGDFNKDQSVSQIAVNMVLGFIPLVDQALDVRDIIAGLKDIIEFYAEDESQQEKHEGVLGLSYEVWIWVNIFIIALGAIPEVGSAIKGVLKTIIKYLGDGLKKAGKLTPGQLRHIWEELLKVLNHLAIKQGNAHQFLKELPSKLGKWMDEAAVKIKAALNSISYMLKKAEELAKRLKGTILSNEKAAQIIERVAKYRKAIEKAFERLEEMKRKVNEWFGEKIKEILGGKHNFEKQGDPLKNAEKTGTNVRKQEEAPVPSTKPKSNVQSVSPKGDPDPKRAEELSWNHEQKKRDIAEGMGGERYERSTGRKLEKQDVEGVDFVDPEVGPISLKGPLVNKKTGKVVDPIKDEMVDGLANSVVKDVKNNTATKRVVVDTAGMNPAQKEKLKDAITAGLGDKGATKEIVFIE